METLLQIEHQPALYSILAGSILVLASSRFFYSYLEKKKTALQEGDIDYKSFFYANPNPLWIYDLESLRFLEVNDAAIANYGYTRKEFLSMDILQIRPEEEHHKLRLSMQKVSADFYKSGHWRHTKKSGDIITVSISSHKIRFSGRDCEMVMALDISDQVLNQESLKSRYLIEKSLKEELEKNIDLLALSYQEKGRLADIIEKVSNIVILTDAYGVITWVNPAFTKHTGYTFQEVVGRDTSFLHGPETDELIQAEIMQSIQAGVVKTFEVLNYRKDGTKYWVDLNISPVYNKEAGTKEYISIQTVITDRKEREQQIKDQNAALRNVAWTNSHALRKPVASIINLAQLGMEATAPEDIYECQKLIKICSEELDYVVKKIGKQVNSCEIDM